MLTSRLHKDDAPRILDTDQAPANETEDAHTDQPIEDGNSLDRTSDPDQASAVEIRQSPIDLPTESGKSSDSKGNYPGLTKQLLDVDENMEQNPKQHHELGASASTNLMSVAVQVLSLASSASMFMAVRDLRSTTNHRMCSRHAVVNESNMPLVSEKPQENTDDPDRRPANASSGSDTGPTQNTASTDVLHEPVAAKTASRKFKDQLVLSESNHKVSREPHKNYDKYWKHIPFINRSSRFNGKRAPDVNPARNVASKCGAPKLYHEGSQHYDIFRGKRLCQCLNCTDIRLSVSYPKGGIPVCPFKGCRKTSVDLEHWKRHHSVTDGKSGESVSYRCPKDSCNYRNNQWAEPVEHSKDKHGCTHNFDRRYHQMSSLSGWEK